MANFTKNMRLRTKTDFGRLLDRSQKAWRESRPGFALVAKPSLRGHSRLGLVVSRKVGNAVARNRLKRRIRAVFREAAVERALRPLDLVFIARDQASDIPYDCLRASLLSAWAQVGGRIPFKAGGGNRS